MSGEYYFNEVVGSGGALFDFDNDGDLDVYLIQGQMLGPGRTLDDALFPPPPGRPLTDRLYRNDLEVAPGGARALRFTDVTEGSGLDAGSYGMGVAAGDFDNDGWTDLYRTRQGPNQLFRNDRDGSFTDVGEASGTADPLWGVAASFVDVDHDGWLDLYVGNYVDYAPGDGDRCRTPTDEPSYCAPKSYPYQPDRLYRNRGDGTFADVTAEAGIDTTYGPALGVVAADLDADGLVDLYVANDGEPNQLWMNQGGWRFRDDALLAGVAVNAVGAAEASMGVDVGDVDVDGDGDLFMTHVSAETNTFYVNDGDGFFDDRSAEAGLGAPSLPYTGFGAAWLDADNGHVARRAGRQRCGADHRGPRPRRRPLSASRAQSTVPQPGRRAFRRPFRSGRRSLRSVGSEPWGRLRRRRQRRRRRRAGDQQQRAGAAPDQRGRPPSPLAGVATGRRARGPSRHARRPGRGFPGRWRAAPLAARARRRELRLGQRSARARGPWRGNGRSSGCG